MHLPQGFVGCSLTFAIHLLASRVSRRALAMVLIVIALGTTLAVPATPDPPSPHTPAVPALALRKGMH